MVLFYLGSALPAPVASAVEVAVAAAAVAVAVASSPPPTSPALLATAASELDPARRHAALQQAETYLIEQTPIAPIYWGTRTTLVHSSVRGWKNSPLLFRNYKDVSLEP
jgi:ABC-type oligopeptide transport system substrate-binding subunit